MSWIFENKEVKVFEFKGQVLFPGYVGKWLNLINSVVRMAILKIIITRYYKHSI